MKKLIIMCLVIIFSSIAGAGQVDLMITGWGTEPDPITHPIEPRKDFTLQPSEWVALSIFYTADPSWFLISISVDITVEGPGILDVGNLAEIPYPWDPALSRIVENIAGKAYTMDLFSWDGVVGGGSPVVAFGGILLQCSGEGEMRIDTTDNTNTRTGGTYEFNWTDFIVPQFGEVVVIEGTSQPWTELHCSVLMAVRF